MKDDLIGKGMIKIEDAIAQSQYGNVVVDVMMGMERMGTCNLNVRFIAE
jgi:hypothetical protein